MRENAQMNERAMTMAMASHVAIRPDVLARRVGDETVILDLSSGTYFGLDPVGGRIWTLIGNAKDAGCALHDVRDAMLAEFDVSREDMERDLVRLAEELQAQKLIAVIDG
jgi:coenzyme PQQ synthesis protein D (PqqD)